MVSPWERMEYWAGCGVLGGCGQEEAVWWKGHENNPCERSCAIPCATHLQETWVWSEWKRFFLPGKKYRRVCFRGRTLPVLARLLSELSARDIFAGQPRAAAAGCLPWLGSQQLPGARLPGWGAVLPALLSCWQGEDLLLLWVKSPRGEGTALGGAVWALAGSSAEHPVCLSRFQHLFCCLLVAFWSCQML